MRTGSVARANTCTSGSHGTNGTFWYHNRLVLGFYFAALAIAPIRFYSNRTNNKNDEEKEKKLEGKKRQELKVLGKLLFFILWFHISFFEYFRSNDSRMTKRICLKNCCLISTLSSCRNLIAFCRMILLLLLFPHQPHCSMADSCFSHRLNSWHLTWHNLWGKFNCIQLL